MQLRNSTCPRLENSIDVIDVYVAVKGASHTPTINMLLENQPLIVSVSAMKSND